MRMMSDKEYSNVNTARRAAVSKAWANERNLVMEGKGTRDWSKSQQAEIIATGKCKGYFGHHKCSVSKNPKEAGNKDNIQLLNAKEHIDAHDGNYKNDPHGRYDPELKKVTKYNNNINPEPVIELSNKMAESRKQSSIKKYEFLQKNRTDKIKERAAKRAKSYERRSIKKESNNRNGEKTSKALRASKAHNIKLNSNTKTSKALSSGKIFSTNGKTSVALRGRTSTGKTSGRGGSLGSGSISGGKSGGHGSAGGSGGVGGHSGAGGHSGVGGHNGIGGYGNH